MLGARPKSAHPGAKKALAEIWNAEDKDHARAAVKAFAAASGAKFPKAAAKVTDDQDELLAFYDYSAEHWMHPRTTNPIESTFATVRLRTKVTKGHGSRAAALAMAFKLIEIRAAPLADGQSPAPGRPGQGRCALRTRRPHQAPAGPGRLSPPPLPTPERTAMPEPTAAPTAFIRAYEQATNSHDIAQVAPLIASDAVYWFTDGSHRGREAVLAAISQTFTTINDEVYRINELEWVSADSSHATCRYRFAWTGTVDGQPRSGSGRGTNVLVSNDGAWQMLHEHLSA